MTADGTPGPKNNPQFLDGGAPDLATDSNLVSNYAALVGNRKVLTKAAREALSGKDVWDGLEVEETDTGLLWKRRSGSWVRAQTQRGGSSLVTVAAGGATRVAHGLGFTPDWVLMTIASHPSVDANSRVWRAVWWNPTTTNATDFAVRLVDERDNSWAPDNQQVRITWLAGSN